MGYNLIFLNQITYWPCFLSTRLFVSAKRAYCGAQKGKNPAPPWSHGFYRSRIRKTLAQKNIAIPMGGRGFRPFEPPSMLVLRTKKDAVIKKHGHMIYFISLTISLMLTVIYIFVFSCCCRVFTSPLRA